MKFYKYLKLVISVVFMLMLMTNIIMYFYIANSISVFGIEINCLYVQLAFILVEALFMSNIYGKKQGLTMCLVYFILITLNLMFIFSNLV